MRELIYPRQDIDVDAVLGQETFDRATAQLMSWRQAAGAFGGLQLHATWGESSSLARRYHGQTAASSEAYIHGFITLFDQTGDYRWKMLIEDVVSNVLFLQLPKGGFFHASGEFEPTYTAEQSCPIHQGRPIAALLAYAGWQHRDPGRATLVRQAVDRHWDWFFPYWNRRGNAWRRPLPFPGFCGVTNQDLVVVANIARYARLYNDVGLYEREGRPVLETYLSQAYYHEQIGLFERGDAANFAERTSYYEVILPMLEAIQIDFPDDRLVAAIDNICRHIFDACVTDAHGLTQLAWGADTDPVDKARVIGWRSTPNTFTGYPLFLPHLRAYAARTGDAVASKRCAEIERTLAAYVYADGSIPPTLWGKEPLFTLASRCEQIWTYLIHRLGKSLKAPQELVVPRIRREMGPITFCSDADQWAVLSEGKVRMAGMKREPSSVIAGPDEQVFWLDADRWNEPDVIERIRM